MKHLHLKVTGHDLDALPIVNKEELALERGKRIRMLRALSGLSRKQFQAQLNVSISTLNIWENGRVCLTVKGAARIVSAVKEVGIECSEEWLLSGLGSPPRPTTSDFLPQIGKSSPETDIFIRSVKNSVHTAVDDELMSPFFRVGDLVAGEAISFEEIESFVGRFILVELDDRTIVRYLDAVSNDAVYLSTYERQTIANDNVTCIRSSDIVKIAPVLVHRSF